VKSGKWEALETITPGAAPTATAAAESSPAPDKK
jgi:hypothetical protein